MSLQNQTQPKFFPRLNIDVLKIHGARWAAQYPDIPINRIILYNDASKFQKYYDEPIKYKKYSVVFETSCEDKLYGLSGEKLLKYDLSVVRGEVTPDPYYYFVKDLEWDTSVFPKKTFKALITEDFTNVYWMEPKDTFRNEWIFIPRPLVYNPERKKIIPMGLPVNVRVDEPNIILFQSEQISKQDIPSASHLNSPDYFPRLNFNHLQRYAKRWVDDIFKEIPIKRIVLYRYSYKFELSKYAIYAVVFVVDEKIPEKVYAKFETALAYLSLDDDADNQKVILELGIDLGFQDVYKERPGSNFLSEWQFLSKISGKKMPREISKEDPHWILFPVKYYTSASFQNISNNTAEPCISDKTQDEKTKLKYSKNETTESELDDFIRTLRIYYDTDDQIKIQVPGKDARPYLYSNFDFRNNRTKQWKTLIKIIQDRPHTFYLTSEKERKRIAMINNKLIKFFRTHPNFSLDIPENYKIYEGFMEVSKKYRFKFQVVSEVKGTLESKYVSFPKDNLIDEICKLSKDYQEHINKVVINKKEHEVLKNKLETQISAASIIALSKKWLTHKEIEDILHQDKETYVYNPHENEENRESD